MESPTRLSDGMVLEEEARSNPYNISIKSSTRGRIRSTSRKIDDGAFVSQNTWQFDIQPDDVSRKINQQVYHVLMG